MIYTNYVYKAKLIDLDNESRGKLLAEFMVSQIGENSHAWKLTLTQMAQGATPANSVLISHYADLLQGCVELRQLHYQEHPDEF
jgi:hypothetical protein